MNKMPKIKQKTKKTKLLWQICEQLPVYKKNSCSDATQQIRDKRLAKKFR